METLIKFFTYIFTLRNDQITFVLFIISIWIIYKKNDELIKKTDKRLDEKDAKLLEIIDKVNDTQLELIKSLGKVRGKIDNNQTAIMHKLDQIKENTKKGG